MQNVDWALPRKLNVVNPALNDFKNAKIKIRKINTFSMYPFYWDLAKININMSRKVELNFISIR